MKPLRIAAPADVLAMAADRHHIISASAGTGKTFAIEHRVVDLIIRGAATIEQILVVTFTEKATAELRLRVRRKLEELAVATESTATDDESSWVLDDDAMRRVEAALFGFDRAPIFTIHGFCHRITSESGFGQGRALHPTQVASEAAFAEAFANLVRTELVTDPKVAPLLEAWFKQGRTAAGLRSHLFRCREVGGALEPRLDPVAMAATVTRFGRAITSNPLRTLDVHANTARAIERWLDVITPAMTAAARADTPEAVVCALEDARPSIRKLADKATPGGHELFAAAAALDAVALDLDAAITAAILPRLEESLSREKRLLGLIDFGDMLGHVAAALDDGGDGALAIELRERFPVALIDEFQDTSELQWRIFRTVYLEGGDAKLTVVGDPKQAIYGFRGADLHTYNRACRELRDAGADDLVLATNYRSTPKLVSALSVITASEPGEAFFIETEADAAVDAGRKLRLVRGDEDVAPVVIADVVGDKMRSDALSRHVTDVFADEVAHLLSDDCDLELVSGSVRRQLLPSDIMILTRSRADSDQMSLALTRRGVPSSTLHNQDLFGTREARELLDLLRAIGNPRSAVLRSRALATRFFDLPLESVATAGSDPDRVDAVALLHRWRAKAERGPLEALLPQVLLESKLALRELALDRGSRTLTNVEHLLELLVADVVRSRCSLGELADRLESRIQLVADGESTEATPVRIEGEGDTTAVMTIHASKGLEAAVVFVFGGYGRRALASERMHTYHADDDSRRLRIGKPPSELTPIIEKERNAEDERLMYVAVTRAAARLYATCVDPSVYRINGPHLILNRRLGAEVASDAALFERRSASTDRKSPELPPPEPSKFEARLLEPPELPDDIEPIRTERSGVAVTSYSRIKKSGGDVAEKLGNDELGVDGSLGRLGGREVGVLVHWILERVDLSALRSIESAEELAEIPEASKLIERSMRGFSLDLRHRARVEQMVFAGLTTPLGFNVGRFCDATNESREVEFTFPVQDKGGLRGYVTGFLDVVLESDNRLYVIDWKSDALGSYDAESLAAHVERAYNTQLELYSLALEQMLSLAFGERSAERFGGVIYCFLRGAACYGLRATASDLASFRDKLLASEATWQR